MSAAAYWCELALVGDAVLNRVTVQVADGRFTGIEPDTNPASGSIRLHGLTMPAMANAHSHAFHRALRGRTQVSSGSFWTWRDVMYQAAGRLDPDSYHALARATFAEMAMAGISAVGEFHYLHHQHDGRPYADPNAMGQALLESATEAGIRITLLDCAYLHGGLDADGYRPPDGVQLRYSDGTAARWAERVSALRPADGQLIAAAIHSVRAVDPVSMVVVGEWAAARQAPLHAHVSEQPAENEQCLARHLQTPTAVIDNTGVLDAAFTAVHATHVTADDIARLAANRSGVCLCPTTERDLGDGIGPSPALAEADVSLSLGTDSHAVIDMMEEARAVELDERLGSGRRGVHRTAALTAMATRNGHASLGWHDAGEIAVGRRADMATISLDSVRTAGVGPATALEAAVFASVAADIRHVVVDGVTAVCEGRHVRVDVPAELHKSITAVMDS